MPEEIDPERRNVRAALRRLYAARVDLQPFRSPYDEYLVRPRFSPILRTTQGVLALLALLAAGGAISAWVASSEHTTSTGPGSQMLLWTAATLAPIAAFLMVLSVAIHVHAHHMARLAERVNAERREATALASKIDEVITALERWLNGSGAGSDL